MLSTHFWNQEILPNSKLKACSAVTLFPENVACWGIAADNLWSSNLLSFVFSHLSFPWEICPQAILQAEGGKKMSEPKEFWYFFKWVQVQFEMGSSKLQNVGLRYKGK